jgi:signal transduction histidine kinase
MTGVRARRQPAAARPAPEAATPILEALPTPIAILDAEGRIAFANAPMRERATGPRDASSFAERFPEYRAALGDDPAVARDAAVVRRANTAVVHERLIARPTPQGLVLALVEEPPSPAPAAFESIQTTRLASLGFMVAGVCHEVSNPLAAIHSMLQILQSKRGASPETLEKGLASISANISRVLAITRTLTDFSRVHDEPMRPVALADIVAEAVPLVRHQTGPGTVAFEVAVDDSAVVLARTGQLEQVVFNILLNAVQAMDGRGRIAVTGGRRGARAVLAIRDHGPGIPEADLARVFEPFYTTKPAGEGTGLGLAISSEIVHELGGELRAENRPDGGACFAIELPLADA